MTPEKISILSVGDIIPDWPVPEQLFEPALPTLRTADIRLGQLECPFAAGAQTQIQAYHARRVAPEKVSALTAAGFDVISFAGNHALDLGEDAFVATIDVLRQNNIGVIGAGRNIAEARMPHVIERAGNRIAFLSYCSVLPKGYDAGADRPGCAPVKVATYYEQIDWQPGTPPRVVTIADAANVAAMKDDIAQAKSIADVVIVSMHWGVHFVPAVLAMYQREVGHAAIDAGADLIIGHHPHLLKAIEVYKGKVIFYSLGNFVVPSVPGRKSEGRMHYKVAHDPQYPLYPYPVDARKTVIAKCVVSAKKIERVSVLPAYINPGLQPEVLSPEDRRFGEVMDYLNTVSRDQDIATELSAEGGEIVVCA